MSGVLPLQYLEPSRSEQSTIANYKLINFPHIEKRQLWAIRDTRRHRPTSPEDLKWSYRPQLMWYPLAANRRVCSVPRAMPISWPPWSVRPQDAHIVGPWSCAYSCKLAESKWVTQLLMNHSHSQSYTHSMQFTHLFPLSLSHSPQLLALCLCAVLHGFLSECGAFMPQLWLLHRHLRELTLSSHTTLSTTSFVTNRYHIVCI